MKQKNNNKTLPAPKGLRTIIEAEGLKNLALVSYRTIVAFRVGFEYELVRAVARAEGKDVAIIGKTLAKTFESYMVAFKSNRDTYSDLITKTGYTQDYLQVEADNVISKIIGSDEGFLDSLTKKAKDTANPIYQSYKDWIVTEPLMVKK
jgi:hypothetical protein